MSEWIPGSVPGCYCLHPDGPCLSHAQVYTDRRLWWWRFVAPGGATRDSGGPHFTEAGAVRACRSAWKKWAQTRWVPDSEVTV